MVLPWSNVASVSLVIAKASKAPSANASCSNLWYTLIFKQSVSYAKSTNQLNDACLASACSKNSKSFRHSKKVQRRNRRTRSRLTPMPLLVGHFRGSQSHLAWALRRSSCFNIPLRQPTSQPMI